MLAIITKKIQKMKKLSMYSKIIIASLAIVLVGCDTLFNEDTIAFDIDQLLDHEEGDIVKYTNGSTVLTFNIINSERILGYDGSVNQIKYLTDQQNSYTISEINNQDDAYIDYLRISLTGPVNQTLYNLKINLEEKLNHVFERNIVEYHEEYNFNGTNYTDVFEVLYDTINYNTPKIPYVVRAIPGGILKFYDSETEEMWELIE